MEGAKQLISFEAAPVSGHGWVIVEGAGESFLSETWEVVLDGLVNAGGCSPVVLEVDFLFVAWDPGALLISLQQVGEFLREGFGLEAGCQLRSSEEGLLVIVVEQVGSFWADHSHCASCGVMNCDHVSCVVMFGLGAAKDGSSVNGSVLEGILTRSLYVGVGVCICGNKVAYVPDWVAQGAGIGRACISLLFFVAEVCIPSGFGGGWPVLGYEGKCLVDYLPISEQSELVFVFPLGFPLYVPLLYCLVVGLLFLWGPVLAVLALATQVCVLVLGLTCGVEASVTALTGGEWGWTVAVFTYQLTG